MFKCTVKLPAAIITNLTQILFSEFLQSSFKRLLKNNFQSTSEVDVAVLHLHIDTKYLKSIVRKTVLIFQIGSHNSLLLKFLGS